MEVLTPEQQMDFRAMMRKNPGMAMHMSMGMGMGYKMKTDKMGMMMKGEGKCPMCDKSMSGRCDTCGSCPNMDKTKPMAKIAASILKFFITVIV